MSAMQRASFVKSMFLLLLIVMHLTAGAPNPPSGPKVAICNDYADIAFVVDMSGSIEGNGKNPGFFDMYVKRFLVNFVQKLNVAPDKIHVGLVTFGNFARLEFSLLSNSDDIIKKINGIVYDRSGKNTNTSGGINVMRTQVLSPKSPNYRSDAAHIAIVVTDGYSTRDEDKTIPSAIEAKKQGITMLVIGVTKEIRQKELIGIASPLQNFDIKGLEDDIAKGVFTSKGYVSYVPEITRLVEVVQELASNISSAACSKSADIKVCDEHCICP